MVGKCPLSAFNRIKKKKTARKLELSFKIKWSGLRGSNPPPSPWQGDALPNELNPRVVIKFRRSNGDSDGARTHDL